MSKSLYEQDVVLWSAEQANALRAAGAARMNTPSPIDWANVAEEIESLGISQKSELKSRIAVILEHLLKLLGSAALEPRRGWMETILTQRAELERLLDDSPSLRPTIGSVITAVMPRVCRTTARKLEVNGEQPQADLASFTFTEDQVLGDWFPGPP